MELTRESFRELADFRADHCVSLFMPTNRSGPEQQQDSLRMEMLLEQAAEKLNERGMPPRKIKSLLAPLRKIRADDLFWRSSQQGLACFCAPGFSRQYAVPILLEESVWVDHRFHVQPLLPLRDEDVRYFLLALSLESARLFAATRDSIRVIDIPVERVEVDGPDETLQFHTHHAGGGIGGGNEALFHGHGGHSDREKADTTHFFGRVAICVQHELREERVPLVLACVDYLAAMYRDVNKYQHLLDDFVAGSPDRCPLKELHRKSWAIIEAEIQRGTERVCEQLLDQFGTGRASADLPDVVLSADDGRVDTLFLVRGAHRWGRVDPAARLVEVADDGKGEELLDFAAARTLSCRGDVRTVERIPQTDSPIAALYRY